MRYQHGGDIYTKEYRLDFSSNMNPFGMSEAVRRRAEDAVRRSFAYPDANCGRLRDAIAEKSGILPEWSCIGNGAAELIFSLALAEKPKKGMIPAPAFQEYEQALQSVDCQVIVYERPERQNFAVEKDFIRRLETELKKGLDIVFLCSPDNPTGAVISKEILLDGLTLCGRYGARIVVDESFCEFAYEEETQTMLPYISEEKQLFILRSFTKMYGIPGLRLGYGISSDRELMERIAEIRQPWNVSLPAQEAGIAALEDKNWATMVRDYVKKQRKWMEKELERLGFRVFTSAANYILFYSDRSLLEPLQERGILIRDCSNYRGLCEGYYRTAVKREKENRELIQALSEICGNTHGKTDAEGENPV